MINFFGPSVKIKKKKSNKFWMINFFGSLCRNFKENTYPKWHFPSHNLSTWIVTKSVKPYFFFIFECTWTYIMIHALNVKQREREDFSFLVNVRKKYFVFFFLLFYMCIYKNIWSNNMDIICCEVYPLIIHVCDIFSQR